MKLSNYSAIFIFSLYSLLPSIGRAQEILDFSEPILISEGINISPIGFTEIIDLDNDNNLDIYYADFNGIYWFKGDGEGGFGPRRVITSLAYNITGVKLGDMDNDGDLDVVASFNGTSQSQPDRINWYQNNGNGVFGPAILVTGLDGPSSLNLEDIDLDGDLDVISAFNGTDLLIWIENFGGGEFTVSSPEIITNIDPVTALTTRTADFNDDGYADIVLQLNSDILYYINNQNNGFLEPDTIITNSIIRNDFQIADLNNDGLLDFLGFEQGYDDIPVYKLSDGDSLFINEQEVYAFNVFIPERIRLEDLNNDKALDIFVTKGGLLRSSYNLNDGAGNYFISQPLLTQTSDPTVDASAVTSGDLDSDGIPDVALFIDSRLFWLKGYGTSSFEQPRLIDLFTDNVGFLTNLDVDEDEDNDLILVNEQTDQVYWLENTQDNFIDNRRLILNDSSVGVTKIDTADVNSDGLTDLIWTNTGRISWKANSESRFSDIQEILILENGFSIMDFSSGDFDNDGDLDFAISANYDSIYTVTNEGEGVFSPANSVANLTQFDQFIAIGQLNSDNFDDIAVINPISDTLLVLFSEGNTKEFNEKVILTPSTNALIEIADINNDGLFDIITSSSDEFYFIINQGDGEFLIQTSEIEVRNISAMEFADFDNDQDQDLFAFGNERALLYSNLGDGIFSDPVILSYYFSGSPAFTIFDFDDDKDLDVVINPRENLTYSIVNNTLIPTRISDEIEVPASFELNQNYPNPFNPSTTIEFSIPYNAEVKLEVFNSIGRKVSTLSNSMRSAGMHQIVFDASKFSSGLYLYRLTFDGNSITRKMLLIK